MEPSLSHNQDIASHGASDQEQLPFEKHSWTTIILPNKALFHIPYKEIWEYRELILQMVYRDFVVDYKQTVLGSFWHIIKPILSSLMYTLVFHRIAKIPTGSVPPILFFLAGSTCWSYLADSITSIAVTFTGNKSLFERVYFPRLTIPIEKVIVRLIGLGMQLIPFLGLLAFFWWQGADIHITAFIFTLPLLFLEAALLGIGIGSIVAAATARFRDLQILLDFFIQLGLYASCVVYPLKMVPPGPIRIIYACNPMVSIIESFRLAFLGQGTISWQTSFIGVVITLLIFISGMLLFNKTEQACVDIL